MSRLKRLNPIMDLAEKRENEAVQALGRSQQKLDEARKGLSSLRSFRENYAARFHQSGTKGLGVRQLNEYRAFLNKINAAIAEQERVVQSSETELQARKAAWEEAHRHTLGMQKIIDKLRAEESRQAQKKEQVELDERASRRGKSTKTLLAVFW